MTLLNEFKARYSTKHITSISNPDSPSATLPDDTNINLAIADVLSDFNMYAWIAIDATFPPQYAIGTACLGIYVRLCERLGSGSDLTKDWARYKEEMERIRCIVPRTRSFSRIDYDSVQQDSDPDDNIPGITDQDGTEN